MDTLRGGASISSATKISQATSSGAQLNTRVSRWRGGVMEENSIFSVLPLHTCTHLSQGSTHWFQPESCPSLHRCHCRSHTEAAPKGPSGRQRVFQDQVPDMEMYFLGRFGASHWTTGFQVQHWLFQKIIDSQGPQ